MDWRDLFEMQHRQVHSALLQPGDDGFSLPDMLLRGMSEEQQRLVPVDGQNSVVWLLWHVTRCEDVTVGNVLSRRGQVLDEGWADDLGVGRRDIGTGMRPEEVRDLSQRVDIPSLLGYRLAVARRTVEVVDDLDDEWLEAPMSDEESAALDELGTFGAHAGWVRDGWATRRRGWFLWLPTGHCYQHLGEAITVRSLGGVPWGW